jgi:hypothetical protein
MLRSIRSSRGGRWERDFLRLSVARWRSRSWAVCWRELFTPLLVFESLCCRKECRMGFGVGLTEQRWYRGGYVCLSIPEGRDAAAGVSRGSSGGRGRRGGRGRWGFRR